jgi:serine/threonine-protein kinase PknK
MAGLRIVVVEDNTLTRAGIVGLLGSLGHEVVGQAGEPASALDIVRASGPQCAVVDIRMPPTHTYEGVELARAIRAHFPATGVLVLSQFLEADFARQVLEGARNGLGYLLKDSVTAPGVLGGAVRRVAALETVVDPHIVEELMSRRQRDDGLAALTDAEQRVLACLAEGYSNAGVAERLIISERTVNAHVRTIMRKLGLPQSGDVHRRVLAVLQYLETPRA